MVVKAQIHAGGRGKGGGRQAREDRRRVRALAKAMLGMTLRTHQTGPEGRVVRRLLIEQGMDLEGAREMYLAIVIDRESRRARGHGLGRRAAWTSRRSRPTTPRPSSRRCVDPAVGFQAFQARKLAFGLGLPAASVLGAAVPFMQALYRAFEETDASLLEINPFLLTARRRPPRPRREDQLRRQRPLPPSRPARSSATSTRRTRSRSRPASISLNYIKLEGGNVGCMVNGAGPGHGHHGHHQARGRQPRELPRRGRRGQRGADPATPSASSWPTRT